jgi:hypothetical protein
MRRKESVGKVSMTAQRIRGERGRRTQRGRASCILLLPSFPLLLIGRKVEEVGRERVRKEVGGALCRLSRSR